MSDPTVTSVAGDGWQQRVNADTTGLQDQPAAARLADGSLVVVYTSKAKLDFGNTAAGNIHARILTAAGTAKPVAPTAEAILTAADGEFLVNNITNAMQWQPAVVALADGGFAVVWSDEYAHNNGSPGYSVQGRVFNADGSPRGAQFRVNELDSGYEFNPQVAQLATGEVVVAWISKAMQALIGADARSKGHVVFRRFDGTTMAALGPDVIATAGLPLDQLPDVEFSTLWGADRSYPALAAASNDPLGRFDIGWFSGDATTWNDPAGGSGDRFLRLPFSRLGGANAVLATAAQLSPAGESGLAIRDLTATSLLWHGMNLGSPTAYAWSERTSGGVSRIRLQLVTPGGETFGTEPTTVVSDSSRQLRYPKLLALSDGSILVSYTAEKIGSSPAEVRVRALDALRQPRLLAGQAELTLLTVGLGTSSSDADPVVLSDQQLVLVSPDYNGFGDPNTFILATAASLAGVPLVPELPAVPLPPDQPDPDPATPEPDACLALTHGIDNGPPQGQFSPVNKPSYPNTEAARKRFIDALLSGGASEQQLQLITFEASQGWGAGNFAGSPLTYGTALVPAEALGQVSNPYDVSVVGGAAQAGAGSLLFQAPAWALAVRFDLQGARLSSAAGLENPGIGRIDASVDVDRGFSTTPTPDQYTAGQWLELVPGSGVAETSLVIRLDRPTRALGFDLIGRETGKNPVRIELELADGSRRAPGLWWHDDAYTNLIPAGSTPSATTQDDGSVQFIGLQVDSDCSPIVAVHLNQALTAAAAAEEIIAIDNLLVWPLPLATGTAPIDLGTPSFPNALSALVHGLSNPDGRGTHFKLDDSQPADRSHQVITSDGPDWVDILANRNVSVSATPAGRWTGQHVARHGLLDAKGSPLSSGDVVGLSGLNRFAFTASDFTAGATSLVLPDAANALFLEDALSPQHADLASSAVAAGQRLLGIDTIWMGNGSGTSVVDLTSTRFSFGDVIVHGGQIAASRAVFWGGNGADTFIAHGADNQITAAGGRNRIELLPYSGNDRLTYLAGGGADDTVINFASWQDRLVLRGRNGTVVDPTTVKLQSVEPLPHLDGGWGSSDALLSWEGNQVRLVGQGYLADQWLMDAGHGYPGGDHGMPFKAPPWLQLA